MVSVSASIKKIVCISCSMGFLAACGTRAVTPGVPTLAAFPGTPTPQCVQEEILPTIEQVLPTEIRPGTDVTVSARGGYFRDSCGGFNESARVYKLYFDDEPIADLSCYVNHCEGKFVIPESVAAGRHCMGVQKGSCQMEVDVEGG